MKLAKYILLTLLTLCFTTQGFAQFNQLNRKQKTRQLFYTYLGPILSGGYNDVIYYDWVGSTREKNNEKGPFFSGGALLTIMTTFLQGDFSIEYMYNNNDAGPLHHMFYSLNGRYVFTINESFFISAGFGVWLETPPANQSYAGSAGIQIPVGLTIKLTEKVNYIFDIFARYGSHGIREDEDTARKMSAGARMGVLFKAGRI